MYVIKGTKMQTLGTFIVTEISLRVIASLEVFLAPRHARRLYNIKYIPTVSNTLCH